MTDANFLDFPDTAYYQQPWARAPRSKHQKSGEAPAGMRDPRVHDERGVKIPWALQKPPENGN